MAYRWIAGCLLATFLSATFGGTALAASDLIEKIQVHLYAGQTEEAATVAKARLAEMSDDDEARFALGTIQFLQAAEHLGQSLHRYGLGNDAYNPGFGLMALPILRLPVPKNPDPDELTYDALRGVLNAFVTDLATAEATLGLIEGDQIDLPLNIGLIRLDLNRDGQGSDDEALWHIFKAVAGAGWLDEATAEKLLIDFDGSDLPWLQAYCHLLMAIAKFPLAHDWQEAFEITFPGLFHMPSSPYRKIGQNAEEIASMGKALGGAEGTDEEYERFERASERSSYVGIADLIAFIHLNHWPVVEPDRMANVLEHLQAMVLLSRENWKRILAETDNGAEWIPNPSQTGVLPRMQVTQEQIDGWKAFLGEFEAILQGKKLIPHWRFDEGINMRRLFLEPSTFDIVLLIQGSAALPYLEEGELTAGETWNQITRLLGGDFFRYFIWFN
jgi:hypothetical protein